MIDYTHIRREIEVLINNTVTTVPVVFENTKSAPVNTEHLEVFDDTSLTTPMDMSGSVSRVHGLITVAIFTKSGIGTERAREIASALDVVFSPNAVVGMEFGTSELYSVGRTEGGYLYQHNLVISYSYFYGQDDSNSC